MFVIILYSGVEDVGEAVLAKVLHRKDAVGLGKRVLAFNPY